MDCYRPFNGNPRMPGLDEDVADYEDAFSANILNPSRAYNDEAFFDYDRGSGAMSDFGFALHHMQSSGLNSFEANSNAAATAYSLTTSMGNDMPWNTEHLQQEEAVINTNLTSGEYQTILSMRARNLKSIMTNPSLDPQPCDDTNLHTSAFDDNPLSIESYTNFHPNPPALTSPMQDSEDWAPGTPLLTLGANAQSTRHWPTNTLMKLQHDQSNSTLHPWSVGNKCPRRGCSVKTVFKTLSSYRMHLRNIHDRPLLCDIKSCSLKTPFGRTTDLKRHQRSVHSQNRDYVCTVPSCEVSFARKDHLSKHMREKHTTYFCPIQHCTRAKNDRFATLEDIRAHVNGVEHGEYECALRSCASAPPSKFTWEAMNTHLRNHHGLQDLVTLKQRLALTSTKTTVTMSSMGRRAPQECTICGGTYGTT